MNRNNRRIIYLIECLHIGGAEKALLRLTSAVKQIGCLPEVWVCREVGELANDFVKANVPVIDCSSWKWNKKTGFVSKRAVLRCALNLRSSQASIFHSFACVGDRSEPLAVSFSNIPGYVIRLASAAPMGLPYAWELKYALADRIIVLTNYARNRLLQSHPELERKVVVIPNGVDTNKFSPVDGFRKDQIKHNLGFSSRSIIITCVARVIPEKNQAGVIRAFAELVSRIQDEIHLLLIGDGSDLPAVQAMVKEMQLSSRVHLLGCQSNVHSFIAASDVFVLLSKPPEEGGVESMSNALLEAMSCGIPVIVSRNGSEEVVTDGSNGYIVGWDDREAIVTQLTKMVLCGGLRRELGKHARATVVNNYNIEKTIDANLAVYDEINHKHCSIRRASSLGRIALRSLARRCRIGHLTS